MRKLNKLQINPEKLMTTEDLLKLRGGTSACTCCCFDPIYQCAWGYLLSEDCSCSWDCMNTFSGSTGIRGNCYPLPPCEGG
jgi:hypothetical protein